MARPKLVCAPVLAGSFALGFAAAVGAQVPDPRIVTVPVADGVWMLAGNGGNLGLGVGEDGAFLIDDQFAPLVGQIKAAVKELTDKEIRFVINTHWHGDHTGGNERFGAAGAVILAHDNVRRRMSVEQFLKASGRRVPPSPAAALPVVTFAEDVTLHWGGDDVHKFHVDRAHTDGDVFVHFTKADVLHLGDVFFASGYPFIDLDSGGSFDGLIAAVERALQLAGEKTKIIPGHGELSDRAGLLEYHRMLTKVRDRVTDLVVKGLVADEVVAEQPTREWDERRGSRFIPPERFARIVYTEVVRVRHAGDPSLTQIKVKGSDMMLDLAQQWAAAYGAADGAAVAVAVTGGGSGAGVAALLDGSVQVALLSRLPRERELAIAAERGVTLRTVEVAREALAVCVHADNPLPSLAMTQLRGIFGAGGELQRWSQLGVELPVGGEVAITPCAQPVNAGATESFCGLALEPPGQLRNDVGYFAGAKDVVDTIARTPGAIGVVPLAYATANEGVRVLAVGEVGSALMPGAPGYPLARSYHVGFRVDLPRQARALVDWIRAAPGREVTVAAGLQPPAPLR